MWRNKNHYVLKGNGNYYHEHGPGHDIQRNDDGKIYTCSGCKVKGVGHHYFCKNAGCTFKLHKDCYEPRIVQTHKFYRDLDFVFHCSPNEISNEPCDTCKRNHRKCGHRGRYCNACGMDIEGYFYRAEGYDLHPRCFNHPRKIRCVESDVKMNLKRKATGKCFSCGNKEVIVDEKKTDQIWTYVSKDKKCHLHVSCMMKTLSDLGDVLEDIDRAITKGGDQTCRNVNIVRDEEKVEIQIKAPKAKKKLEEKFKTIMKYAKIVLGALISVLFGDPTTLIINLLVAFI